MDTRRLELSFYFHYGNAPKADDAPGPNPRRACASLILSHRHSHLRNDVHRMQWCKPVLSLKLDGTDLDRGDRSTLHDDAHTLNTSHGKSEM
jgi:hypothetical protein